MCSITISNLQTNERTKKEERKKDMSSYLFIKYELTNIILRVIELKELAWLEKWNIKTSLDSIRIARIRTNQTAGVWISFLITHIDREWKETAREKEKEKERKRERETFCVFFFLQACFLHD